MPDKIDATETAAADIRKKLDKTNVIIPVSLEEQCRALSVQFDLIVVTQGQLAESFRNGKNEILESLKVNRNEINFWGKTVIIALIITIALANVVLHFF